MTKDYQIAILSHHKCATNWLRAICRVMEAQGLIATEIVQGKSKSIEGDQQAALPRVLLNVNASRQSTENIDFSAKPVRHFVRDPRDALVSNYWSWRKSHVDNSEIVLRFREASESMTIEEGLIELIRWFPMGKQLSSWTDEMYLHSVQVRYEDLLSDFHEALLRLFPFFAPALDTATVEKIRIATDFSQMSKGRVSGEEDVTHHFRKGVAGDWKNYFTPAVEVEFMDKYGWMGVRLGYW